MCGKGTSQTTTSSNSPPKEVMENYKWVTDLAKQFESGAKFTPYTGEMVAGLTPTQEAGIANVNAAQGMSQPYYQAGAQYAQAGAQSRTPEFSQGLVSQYMSPYIQNVADKTFANLNEMNAQQQQQVLGSSIGRGAYGGDRAGIAQAELARQQGLSTGATMGNIYQGGYGQALGQMNQNISQNQADAIRQLQAGQMLGQLGSGAQTSALEGAKAQISAGANQQAVRQAQDVANQQQFQAAQQFPYQNLSWLANLLSGVGSQMGGTSSTTQPGPSVGSQVLGGIMSLASIPWSDKRLKHDIHEVGKTHDGQPIYTFKYNGDDTTQMGLMAQDVEKKHPEAVYTDRSYKKVDYDKATEDARVHKYHGGLVSSQGGVVGPQNEREGFAVGSSVFGALPYSTQPDSTKVLTLGDISGVPSSAEVIMRGSTLPRYPKPMEDDKSSRDISKGLQGMTPQQRATVAANIDKLKGVAGLTVNVDPKTGVAPVGSRLGAFDGSGNSPTGVAPVGGSAQAPGAPSVLQAGVNGIGRLLGFNMNEGGVVGRKGYADGLEVAPTHIDPSVEEPTTEVPAAPIASAATKPATGIVRDSGQTLGEKIFGYQISPEARMGLMAAGLGIMSGRSPFFGVNVGEGALGGLNTYYNTLKNQRDYDIEQQKLGLEGRKVDISGGQLKVAQLEARIKAGDYSRQTLSALRDALSSEIAVSNQMSPTGDVDPALFQKLQEVTRRLSELPSTVGQNRGGVVNRDNYGLGGSPENKEGDTGGDVMPKPQGENIQVAQAAAGQTPPVVPAPAPAPAPAQQEQADPYADVLFAPSSGYQDPTFLEKIDPRFNPFVLEKKAKIQALMKQPELAKQYQEDAQKYLEMMTNKGMAIGKGGVQIPVPGGAITSQVEKNSTAVQGKMADVAKTADANPRMLEQLDNIEKAGLYYEPSLLGPFKAKVQGYASGAGFDISPEAAEQMQGYGVWQKEAIQNIMKNVASMPGQAKVAEITAFTSGFPGTETLDAQTAKRLVGELKANVIYNQKYNEDFAKAYEKTGGNIDITKFNMKFNKENPYSKFVHDSIRDTAFFDSKIFNSDKSVIPSKLIAGNNYVVFGRDGKPMKARYLGTEDGQSKWQSPTAPYNPE